MKVRLPFFRACRQCRFHWGTVGVLVCVATGATDALPDCAEFTEVMRTHFEWGEYPQIIKKVPPFLDSAGTTCDSTLKAMLHLCLGTAFFADGRIPEARRAYEKSFSHDSLTRIDSQFVSKAIQDFYDTVIEGLRRQQQEQYRRDSLQAVTEVILAQKNTVQHEIAEQGLLRQRNAGIAVGVGFTSGAALLFTAAWRARVAAKNDYERFLYYARTEPDLKKYRDYRTRVRRSDLAALLYGIGGCAFVTVSIPIWRRMANLKREIRRLNGTSSSPGDGK